MGHHTFDPADAERLERPERYRRLSVEELDWALRPGPGETVVDLGSGTGFYTDDLAERFDAVYAVDLQSQMHDFYREKGVPENVVQVTAAVGALPFAAGSFDAAVSTMTYHEFASEAALADVARVLPAGGRFVVVDWAATGSGTAGPPLAERYSAREAVDALEAASFEVEHVADRKETFLIVATAP